MFKLVSKYEPNGDQPEAIKKLVEGIQNDKKEQVLLGATGTGKTFTIANVIKEVNKPTLVLAHNKTLAGQLYSEFKELFPNNHVEYFVSYYDYYQPEAYVPSSDTYIEKDASINDEIDELRHGATSALINYDDVIVVSSVSCIYGIPGLSLLYTLNPHLLMAGHVTSQGTRLQLIRAAGARLHQIWTCLHHQLCIQQVPSFRCSSGSLREATASYSMYSLLTGY